MRLKRYRLTLLALVLIPTYWLLPHLTGINWIGDFYHMSRPGAIAYALTLLAFALLMDFQVTHKLLEIEARERAANEERANDDIHQ